VELRSGSLPSSLRSAEVKPLSLCSLSSKSANAVMAGRGRLQDKEHNEGGLTSADLRLDGSEPDISSTLPVVPDAPSSETTKNQEASATT